MSTTTLGISQFPFAGVARREPAPAAAAIKPASSNPDNSFLTALIDSAEKQSREKVLREQLAAEKAAQEVAHNAAQEAARNAIRNATRKPARAIADEPRAARFEQEIAHQIDHTIDNEIPEEPIDVPAMIRRVRPPARTPSSPLLRAFSWLNRKYTLNAAKQLRVAETVSLGDKRFVAVVHVAGQKFLIGGGSQGVSLLTQLDAANGEQTAAAFAGDAE